MINHYAKLFKKIFIYIIIFFVFLVILPSKTKAETLVYSYGPASVNNINGFLVSQIDNYQVSFPFIPGHSYRMDISEAVNPNTFWIGICNDNTINSMGDNVCNPAAKNYSNNGNFSVTFTNIDSTWFDVWGNCEGYGMCSISGLRLYDTSVTTVSQKLTIVTQLTTDNGGDAQVENFTPKVGDTTVVSGVENSFDPGTYSVTETGPLGYTQTFSEDCANGQIILNSGDAPKTCTITNDDIPPQLTVVKHVSGGDKSASNFTLNVSGTHVSNPNFSGNENGTTLTLDAGSYTVTEQNSPDYVSSTGGDCNGTISVGQTKTCTFTNTYVPPPSPSVTKVVLIPGLGASWNINAFMSCSKSSSDNSGWSLAPYAQSIYQNLSDKLAAKKWQLIPFYYDWRQDVKTNTPLLTKLINKSVNGDEKVDIVGHSMGGLIGENYLVSQNGGSAAKFLAVGTPNQGSALAYPAVINGEVWTNDLVQKIAATLFIDHCGIPASFKNLLPVYDYLKDFRTGSTKSVGLMKTTNNLPLPINLANVMGKVKIGTLIGNNQQTLKTIYVTDDRKWPDGKPIKEDYTNDGDNTVLTSSAQIPNAPYSATINESHSGIIASDDGVDKIFKFIGLPGIADPDYSEHKYALVIVGYPGEFKITGENNTAITSTNGMVAIMDPTDGNYQLQIDPNSNSPTFIVSQFLSNGQTEYKEYKFKGKNQDPKVIEFDSKHPKADILHEATEYNKPHFTPYFPKFWSFFWNFWNKLRR